MPENLDLFEEKPKGRKRKPKVPALVLKETTSFSQDYVGMPVVDRAEERVGKILDLAVKMGEPFPPVTSLAVEVSVRTGSFGWAKFPAIIPWIQVEEFDENLVKLSILPESIRLGALKKNELLLGKSVMDQQVVDSEGRKLLRVNEVKLREVDGRLRLAGVEVGMKGLIGRLGGGKRLEHVASAFRLKVMENIIMWDLVEKFDSEMKRIKLGISQDMLKDLYNL
jgi:magnesium transporter